MTTFSMTVPLSFDLHATINSHGWYELPPFSVDEFKSELRTVISLTSKKHVVLSIRQQRSVLTLSVLNTLRLTTTEKEKIKHGVRLMLRIDEPLEEFYTLCRKEEHLRWVPRKRAGRILRSPTLFEDVVKMMLTTNCSWALTKIQTTHLTQKLGAPLSHDQFSFPLPEVIAGRSERWLRKEISCGYRAPYLLALCKQLADESLEIESMRHSDLPSEELYKKFRSIKGIGHYAAGNLMKLIGRYDYLGIDSWVRKRFSHLHRNGRSVADSTIERHYHRYGRWRGLICLMEITSDWH